MIESKSVYKRQYTIIDTENEPGLRLAMEVIDISSLTSPHEKLCVGIGAAPYTVDSCDPLKVKGLDHDYEPLVNGDLLTLGSHQYRVIWPFGNPGRESSVVTDISDPFPDKMHPMTNIHGPRPIRPGTAFYRDCQHGTYSHRDDESRQLKPHERTACSGVGFDGRKKSGWQRRGG